MDLSPEQSELGKQTLYDSHYNPDKLFPIARAIKRRELGILFENLPFKGLDFWTHYEVSWLNTKGKPIVAIAKIQFNCDSPFLIESKSMKLYFNSFNQTQFQDADAVRVCLKKDLEERVRSEVIVELLPLEAFHLSTLYASLEGECLDDLDIGCSQYQTDPTLLVTEDPVIAETVHSHLLKSNCLVTGQPDWGSIQIDYQGPKINHESLLRYIVSYRDHTEFGEHCVERFFMDLWTYCKPSKLTVYGQYTRRGGIDIAAIRSSEPIAAQCNQRRLCRQ